MAKLSFRGKVILGNTLSIFAGEFSKHILEVSRKQKKRLEIVWARKLKKLVAELAEATPAYTGAAAGITGNAKVDGIPAWHPAYGMTIGNQPGDTGWQLKQVERDGRTLFQITNPMWRLYLVYVNSFGIHAGFVERAWEDFKSKEGFK
jgi:hypothetical protein